MRLLRYLNEVYLDGNKVHGDIMNVYKNPTPMEMRDIRDDAKYGFRFIIDTEKKNFYVTSAEFTHSEMFEKSKELQKDVTGFKFNSSYFREGKGLDRILTGSTEKRAFNEIYSDTLTSDITASYNEDNWQYCYDQLQILIKKDFSFMSKWIHSEHIKNLIQTSIDHLQDIMTGEEDPD